MKKFIALLVITSILMVAILPAALAQQTAAPGSVITVEFSFSGPDVYFVDFHYALSSGLSVEGGSALAGGSMGKAGSTRAIFLRPGLAKFNGDTLQLKIKVKEDATGEQTVDLTKIEGYVLGTGMKPMNGAAKKTITISSGGLKGDATGDGKVNHEDVTAIILLITTGKPVKSQVNADASGDNLVDHKDLTAVILHITGAKKLH